MKEQLTELIIAHLTKYEGFAVKLLSDKIIDLITTEVERRVLGIMPAANEYDKLAEAYADSVDRRGCSYWNGMYRGYKRALEDVGSRVRVNDGVEEPRPEFLPDYYKEA